MTVVVVVEKVVTDCDGGGGSGKGGCDNVEGRRLGWRGWSRRKWNGNLIETGMEMVTEDENGRGSTGGSNDCDVGGTEDAYQQEWDGRRAGWGMVRKQSRQTYELLCLT